MDILRLCAAILTVRLARKLGIRSWFLSLFLGLAAALMTSAALHWALAQLSDFFSGSGGIIAVILVAAVVCAAGWFKYQSQHAHLAKHFAPPRASTKTRLDR